jgi:hypothetical protein
VSVDKETQHVVRHDYDAAFVELAKRLVHVIVSKGAPALFRPTAKSFL